MYVVVGRVGNPFQAQRVLLQPSPKKDALQLIWDARVRVTDAQKCAYGHKYTNT